jgi:hypothetical protein
VIRLRSDLSTEFAVIFRRYAVRVAFRLVTVLAPIVRSVA